MKVNFYATLRPLAGQKSVEFELGEGVTVQQLLDAVVTRFPAMRDELLDPEGHLFRHVHLFINGRDAPFLDNQLNTVIQPSDKIDIFPAVGGGCTGGF